MTEQSAAKSAHGAGNPANCWWQNPRMARETLPTVGGKIRAWRGKRCQLLVAKPAHRAGNAANCWWLIRSALEEGEAVVDEVDAVAGLVRRGVGLRHDV